MQTDIAPPVSAAEFRDHFEVALVFSTKYEPRNPLLDRWSRWTKWKRRFFGFHRDLPPAAAARVLDGAELAPTFGWKPDRIIYGIAGGMDALSRSIENAEDDEDSGRELVRSARLTKNDVVIGVDVRADSAPRRPAVETLTQINSTHDQVTAVDRTDP